MSYLIPKIAVSVVGIVGLILSGCVLDTEQQGESASVESALVIDRSEALDEVRIPLVKPAQLFASDSFWNQKIATNSAIDPRSSAMVRGLQYEAEFGNGFVFRYCRDSRPRDW